MSGNQVATRPANRQSRKCLIVTGDDFGLNSRVNEAVEELHREGLLTQASLMVNEPGVEEALRIARRNPRLAVGLHLCLCCGQASRPSALTDAGGRLIPSPAWAGLRYAFESRLARPLRDEIAAQFEKFAALGLPPIYWDGHTHLHLHPTVLKFTLPIAHAHGFRATRLVREPGIAPLQIIFRILSRTARPKLIRHGVRFTRHVFGLRHTGQITTHRLELFLASLPEGWSEVYFHPGAEPAQFDCSLLTELAEFEGIRLATAQELPDQALP